MVCFTIISIVERCWLFFRSSCVICYYFFPVVQFIDLWALVISIFIQSKHMEYSIADNFLSVRFVDLLFLYFIDSSENVLIEFSGKFYSSVIKNNANSNALNWIAHIVFELWNKSMLFQLKLYFRHENGTIPIKIT